MSITLFEFSKSFVNGRLSADDFANAYMELWKIERDNNILDNDDVRISECLSSIFCLADLYNPKSSRKEYELDAYKLKTEVTELIHKVESR